MPEICQDRFWDSNLTWYSASPNFTDCFQKFIFIVTPCVIFLLASIVSFIWSCKLPTNNRLPWTSLIVSKIVLAIILLGISAFELTWSLYRRFMELSIADVDIFASSARAITYVIVILVLVRNRDVGRRSSTLLTMYWCFSLLVGAILLRSTILRAFFHQYLPIMQYQYLSEFVHYPVLFCQFVLSLFRDKTDNELLEGESPFDEAPLFTFLTLSWFNKLVWKGRKTLLTPDDFIPMSKKMKASYVYDKFQAKWRNEMDKFRAKSPQINDPENKSTPSLVLAMVKAFWPWLLIGTVLQISYTLLLILPPLILDRFLTFIENSHEFVWKGYVFSIGLSVVKFGSQLTWVFFTYFSICFGLQIRSALFSAICRKTMRLSSSAKRQYTTGQIVNFMSVDVEKIYNFCTYCTFLFGPPVQLVCSLPLLWMYLGPSCLSGIAVLAIMSILTLFISHICYCSEEAK